MDLQVWSITQLFTDCLFSVIVGKFQWLMGLKPSFVSVTELGFSRTNIVLVTKPKLLLLPEGITRDQREPGVILCEDRKRSSSRGVYKPKIL